LRNLTAFGPSQPVNTKIVVIWLTLQLSSRVKNVGPLSLVSKIEELLEKKKSSGSGLERREYGRRDPSR
jgi:hypothetical protein